MKKSELKYQFTAMPVNLMCCLDNNCRSMLFTLLQLSSYYASEDGWFFRSNADLQAQSRLSDKMVRAVISTFYRIGILEVKTVGQSRGAFPNQFKLNASKFVEWEKLSLEDCIKNPSFAIPLDDYKQKGWKPSYLLDNSSHEGTGTVTESSLSPHNIDNEEIVDNAENEEKKKENIDTYQVTLGTSDWEQSQYDEVDRYQREEDMYMRILEANSYNWRRWEDILTRLDAFMEKSPSPDLADTTYWKIRSFLNQRVPYFQQKYEEDPDSEDAIDFENQLAEWADYSKLQSGAFSYFGDE